MIRVDDGLLSRRPGGAVSVQKPGCRGGGVACEWPQEPRGPRVGARVSWGLFLWGAEKAAPRGATGSHLGSTALLSWGLFGFPSHFLSILKNFRLLGSWRDRTVNFSFGENYYD